MKIWVVFVLCAGALSLPVNDRSLTPEELILRVLAAHPLENDIALSKPRNETSPQSNSIGESTLNEEGPPLNTAEEEPQTEIPSQEPEIPPPEVATPAEELEEAPVMTADVGDMTFDPKIEVVDQRPRVEVTPLENPGAEEWLDQLADSEGGQQMVAEEEQTKGAGDGVDEEPVPSEDVLAQDADAETNLDTPTEDEPQSYPEIFDLLPVILDEPISDQDPIADPESLDSDMPMENVPLEKEDMSKDDITERPELYYDKIMPIGLFRQTNPLEKIPETPMLQNPILLPDDILPEEPDLLEAIPPQESPEGVPTETYPPEGDQEETDAIFDETANDNLKTSNDNIPSPDFIAPFEEEEYQPFDGSEMTQLLPSEIYNPELFKRIETPALFGEPELFGDANPELSPLDEEGAEDSPQNEGPSTPGNTEDGTTYDDVTYDEETASNGEEPLSETDYQQDTGLPMEMMTTNEDTNSEPILPDEQMAYDQAVQEDNPEMAMEPVPEMDENEENIPDEVMLPTEEYFPDAGPDEPIPENENPDLIVDNYNPHSPVDRSVIESFGKNPTTDVDTDYDNTQPQSEFMPETYSENIPPGTGETESYTTYEPEPVPGTGETESYTTYEPEPYLDEYLDNSPYGDGESRPYIDDMEDTPYGQAPHGNQALIDDTWEPYMDNIPEIPYEAIPNVEDYDRFETHIDEYPMGEHPLDTMNEHPMDFMHEHPMDTMNEHPMDLMNEYPLNTMNEHPMYLMNEHPLDTMNEDLPVHELTESSFHDTHDHGVLVDPSGYEPWQNEESYDESYQPINYDDSEIPVSPYLPEDTMDMEYPRQPETPITEENEMPVSHGAPEVYPDTVEPQEEHLMPRDMSQTHPKNGGDGRSKNRQNSIPFARESEYDRPRPTIQVPFPVTQDDFYPYSFIMKDYHPFYFPYPTGREFIEKSSPETDYKSVIIVLDPSAGRSAPDSDKSSPDTDKVETTNEGKQNDTTIPVTVVAEQPHAIAVVEEDPPTRDPSFKPDLEIPYPSGDQQFFSGHNDQPRQPFTWYPMAVQQPSNFRRSRPVTSNEYVYVNPYHNTVQDFSQYPTEYYDLRDEPYYYQSGNEHRSESYNENPFYSSRREFYDSQPVGGYDQYYY